MMKKDILVLCQYFYPEYISSATLPFQLCEDLVKKGFSLKVLCGYPKEYATEKNIPKKELYHDIFIRRVHYLQSCRARVIGRIVNFLSLFCAMLPQIFQFAHFKMILVFTTPPIFPFLAAIGTRLFRKKLIVVCYDLYPQLALDFAGMKRGGFTERLMVWMNRFTYRTAARIVVLSEEMKKELLSAYPTWSRKIEIIPNWQDEKDFPSYQLEPQINDQKRPFTVAYTGNMGICQDMDTILKAAGLLKNRDIRFILAGHGVKAGVLQEKAQSQRLNMEFQGFLTGKAYTALLKQADCQLLSIRNGVERYSAPSKTYSYLAAGKPIIAILKPSCALARELSEKGAAFIVREGDVNGVADAILKLSRNPQLAKKMGENARKLFEERYTRTINTEKYATMLFEIKKEGDEKAC